MCETYENAKQTCIGRDVWHGKGTGTGRGRDGDGDGRGDGDADGGQNVVKKSKNLVGCVDFCRVRGATNFSPRSAGTFRFLKFVVFSKKMQKKEM